MFGAAFPEAAPIFFDRCTKNAIGRTKLRIRVNFATISPHRFESLR
ncbi:hypothetical protein CES86_1374 [Brucella lupini]|uniref:Uncharacterized protein n=1 Tax=Brucella lupini TaxID=255457 RepID=A0A256GVG3_9HYPH|nr:hypothetical protein CES86_1374 [Brucella lupini]